MAIIQENAGMRIDGVKLVLTRSDSGKMIRQNETGNVYASAVDVEGANFTYSETDIDAPIKNEQPTNGGKR